MSLPPLEPTYRKRRKWPWVLLALLLLLAGGLYVAPWHSALETQLKQFLTSKGFQNVSLSISQISLTSAELKDISFRYKAIKLAADRAGLSGITKAANNWTGNWQIENLTVSDLGTEIPPLAGQGTLAASPEAIAAEGSFASADKAWNGNFKYENAALDIKRAALPWNGGTVSVENVHMKIGADAPTNLTLQIRKVDLNALLQQLTGKRATGTGIVSGDLPATITKDNTIIFRDGQLSAEAPGTITMAPDAIPGDNEQLALMREVLKNFHYSLLSVDVASDKENKLSITMKLEGNNPDAYDGKPVKLNVHLGGDVLDFIQQNVLTLNDPKKYLEHQENAQ